MKKLYKVANFSSYNFYFCSFYIRNLFKSEIKNIFSEMVNWHRKIAKNKPLVYNLHVRHVHAVTNIWTSDRWYPFVLIYTNVELDILHKKLIYKLRSHLALQHWYNVYLELILFENIMIFCVVPTFRNGSPLSTICENLFQRRKWFHFQSGWKYQVSEIPFLMTVQVTDWFWNGEHF